ncbi:MAG TPA: acyltransferase [Candidatus Tidjanibacter gallistercoris]|nr:acyltransferase [Candidatus Tidjanibacter gallistercoris]
MKEIDVYKVIESKNPKLARRVPHFVVNYLRRTIHEREVNEILTKFGDLEGIEFVRAALGCMNVRYHSVGMERLDPKGRYVFASNHPFGGLDGLMLADEVVRRFGDVRVVVNDLLMHLEPIRGLFVPVNKHGRQNGAGVEAFNDAFASDLPIVTFPAGLCSRRRRGVVRDLEWKPNFVKKAAAYDRDVVPVYFDGQLSDFFYRLSNIRTSLGIGVNIEMLYLVDEMFRQAGSDFEMTIGAPIPSASLLEGRTPRQAADYVRRAVYALKRD